MLNSQTFAVWAREAGFAEIGFCPPDRFCLSQQIVESQEPLSERKQLRFSPLDDLPEIKSISPRNILYIKCFYDLYSRAIQNTPQLVAQMQGIDNAASELQLFSIPWGHHRFIIDKCYHEPEKALFFVQKTVENGWSRAMLLNFLDTDLYARQGKAITSVIE